MPEAGAGELCHMRAPQIGPGAAEWCKRWLSSLDALPAYILVGLHLRHEPGPSLVTQGDALREASSTDLGGPVAEERREP